MKNLCLLIFIVAAVISGSAQERYLKPVDEAAKDPTLVEFREKLIEAAEKKDTKYIISVMDPAIHLSFGGHSGIKDFKEMWQPDAKNSVFWKEFLSILKLGGSFGDVGENGEKYFFAPYIFSNFPDYPDQDIFSDGAVTGTDVNLRAKPSLKGKVIGSLSYNIVRIDYKNSVLGKDPAGIKDPPVPNYEWYKVETLGGKKGYVSADYVRGHVDHRIGFEKKPNGTWKIAFLIAGD